MSFRTLCRDARYRLVWLDRTFWVNRRFDGRHLGVVQKSVTHRVSWRSSNTVQAARFRAPPQDAKRPSRVSSCRKSAIRCPTPAAAPCSKNMTNSTSLGKLARVVARNGGQPAGREVDNKNQRRKRATTCAKVRTDDFGTITALRTSAIISWCAELESESTGRATKCCNRSGQLHQACKGACAAPGRGRRSQRCPICVSERLLCRGSSKSPWSRAPCCHDGSLAVTQPVWVQQTAEELTSFDSVPPRFAKNVHALVRVPGIQQDLAPSLVPLLLWCSFVIAAHETGGRARTEVRDGSVLMEFSMGQQPLAQEKMCRFQWPCRSKIVPESNRSFGTQRVDLAPSTSQGSRHRSGARWAAWDAWRWPWPRPELPEPLWWAHGVGVRPDDGHEGQAKEIDKLKTRGVYKVVPSDQNKLFKMIRTWWVETLKGDEVRCRFVAQEFAKGDPRDDLFASTPPLSLARLLVSWAASSRKRMWTLMTMDVSCAFLYAAVEWELYIELPAGEGGAGRVGHLRKVLCGARDAPALWQKTLRHAQAWLQGERVAAWFLHPPPEGGARCDARRWLPLCRAHWGSQVVQAGAVGELRHHWPVHRGLRREEGRRISKVANGYDWEADPKHVKILLEELRLTESLWTFPWRRAVTATTRLRGTAGSPWTWRRARPSGARWRGWTTSPSTGPTSEWPRNSSRAWWRNQG